MRNRNNKLVRYFLFIMVMTLTFGFNVGKSNALQYTNYYGIEMTNDEYLTLLSLGFDEDEIYFMQEDTFNVNKDLDAELVAKVDKYYKTTYPMYGASYTEEVSEYEYLHQGDAQPLGTVTTEYKQVVTTISANGSKYRYHVSEHWKKIPSNKSYDVIGIGMYNDVKIDSSVYFSYTYGSSSGGYTTSYLYYDRKSTSTGGSVVYKLPSSFVSLSSGLYFDVAKNTSGTITGLTMCGDYAHSTTTVTSTQAANHVIHIGGIDFDSSVINKFDSMPCAVANANVTW